jgi:hypothetical protein
MILALPPPVENRGDIHSGSALRRKTKPSDVYVDMVGTLQIL